MVKAELKVFRWWQSCRQGAQQTLLLRDEEQRCSVALAVAIQTLQMFFAVLGEGGAEISSAEQNHLCELSSRELWVKCRGWTGWGGRGLCLSVHK